jgi:hypothetical protein
MPDMHTSLFDLRIVPHEASALHHHAPLIGCAEDIAARSSGLL